MGLHSLVEQLSRTSQTLSRKGLHIIPSQKFLEKEETKQVNLVNLGEEGHLMPFIHSPRTRPDLMRRGLFLWMVNSIIFGHFLSIRYSTHRHMA